MAENSASVDTVEQYCILSPAGVPMYDFFNGQFHPEPIHSGHAIYLTGTLTRARRIVEDLNAQLEKLGIQADPGYQVGIRTITTVTSGWKPV